MGENNRITPPAGSRIKLQAFEMGTYGRTFTRNLSLRFIGRYNDY